MRPRTPSRDGIAIALRIESADRCTPTSGVVVCAVAWAAAHSDNAASQPAARALTSTDPTRTEASVLLGVLRDSRPVEDDALLVADDPGVVPRGRDERVAGAHLDLLAVVHADP